MPGGWAHTLFHRIAVPRLPGSEAVAEVENLAAGRLEACGYRVERQEFATSPHRLRAGSLVGAGVGWWALLLFPLLILPFPDWIVTATGVAALAAVGLLAAGVAGRLVPTGHSLVTATNLMATRSAEPRCWLVAHSDSKGQRLSLRGRVIAVASVGIGAGGLMIMLALRLGGPLPVTAVAPWAALALAGGAALAGPALVGGSPGAVDNASGIIAALAAADSLKDRSDIGVLITGAEEFGMEGARAWVTSQVVPGAFVNFDGVDACGAVNLMLHPPGVAGAGRVARETPRRLRRALADALRAAGYRVRESRLPLGVFVDGSVLGAAGFGGMTVSRGSWRTLGVVHTPRDTADRTDPASAIDIGRIVAGVARDTFG